MKTSTKNIIISVVVSGAVSLAVAWITSKNQKEQINVDLDKFSQQLSLDRAKFNEEVSNRIRNNQNEDKIKAINDIKDNGFKPIIQNLICYIDNQQYILLPTGNNNTEERYYKLICNYQNIGNFKIMPTKSNINYNLSSTHSKVFFNKNQQQFSESGQNGSVILWYFRNRIWQERADVINVTFETDSSIINSAKTNGKYIIDYTLSVSAKIQ